jgi:hypothetical protein
MTTKFYSEIIFFFFFIRLNHAQESLRIVENLRKYKFIFIYFPPDILWIILR